MDTSVFSTNFADVLKLDGCRIILKLAPKGEKDRILEVTTTGELSSVNVKGITIPLDELCSDLDDCDMSFMYVH